VLRFIEDPPVQYPKYKMHHMEIGQIFKTEDNKILMRVEICVTNRLVYPNTKFGVVNLQTGKFWEPTESTQNESVKLLSATMHIAEIV